MTEVIQLVTARSPFGFATDTQALAHGPTIAELLQASGMPPGAPVRVYVNGDLIFPEFYRVVRPKPGSHVLLRRVAHGGGGGSTKSVGTIVAGILLIVIGAVVTLYPGTFGALAPVGKFAIGAGVSLLLSGEMRLVIPAARAR